MKKNKRFFIILFVLGFIFRLFLALQAYDTLVFDAKGYSDFAIDFLNGKPAIDCCAKNVGYGAFLALVYKLFGVENIVAVRLVHIIIDLVTAGMIYKIALRIFSKKAAIFSIILYLFNPFTSAFTGLVMAETVSIFLVVALLFFLTRASFPSDKKLWFVFGIAAGALLFTRHSFYYFLPLLLVVLTMLVGNIRFLPIAGAGFLLASSYSLIVYYKTFGKLSLVPPYNLKYEIIYLNFWRWHYPEVEFKGELAEYRQVVQGYWNTPLEGKASHSEKYKQLLLSRLPKEWPTFISNIAVNIIWLWDKDHLYTYVDPFYPADRWPLRIINVALILLWAVGMIKGARKEPVFLFSVLLFFYITFLFSLLSNESRHTLVYYPILSLWAGRAFA